MELNCYYLISPYFSFKAIKAFFFFRRIYDSALVKFRSGNILGLPTGFGSEVFWGWILGLPSGLGLETWDAPQGVQRHFCLPSECSHLGHCGFPLVLLVFRFLAQQGLQKYFCFPVGVTPDFQVLPPQVGQYGFVLSLFISSLLFRFAHVPKYLLHCGDYFLIYNNITL
jgi:hypothetical protein